LNRRTALARTLLASAAIAFAVGLGGCQTDGTFPEVSSRAMKPLSPDMLAKLEQKNMPVDSPILVRVFKEEAELEVWKADTTGQFSLLKTYPICRWSGELGPKVKEGDRQAPEGFYAITPGQMNPNSNYYLAFNLGFPNAYDRANDRHGAFLMVHGDCSSSGCYAMTDEQMSEIYALGREAFFGGQKSFQVQAYPFRMTPLNMAKHRNNPNMAFWRMLKDGNDHFEVSRLEPKIDVCEKRYVFDAVAPGNPSATLRFDPRGRCPAFEVQPEIASALADKKTQDEREYADLVSRGTTTVAVRTGNDGGMNPIFAAKLTPSQRFDNEGRSVALAGTVAGAGPKMPAQIINPPKNLQGGDTTGAVVEVVSAKPARVACADASTRVTSRQGDSGGGMFNFFGTNDGGKKSAAADGTLDRMSSTVSSWFGLRGSKDEPPPAKSAAANAVQTRPAPPKTVATAARQAPAKPAPQTAQKVANPPASAATPPAPSAEPASATPALMAGAQPVVQSGSFESRWGGVR